MPKKHSFAAVRFLLLIISVNAAADDFIPRMGEDLHELFQPEPLIILGAGGVLSAFAMSLEDPEGNAGFMGEGTLRDLSEVVDVSMGYPLLGGAVLLWAGGGVFDSQEAEDTGQMLSEGLLITYGITGVLKIGTARIRPDGSNSRSFPSGHAAGTACTAVILWDRYGAGAGIPAALIAGFTVLSRITLGKHYPSDVIAGAAVGAAAGLAVVNAYEDDGSDHQIQPAPGIRWSSSDGFGIYF